MSLPSSPAPGFAFDTTAPETLACALMDALIAGHTRGKRAHRDEVMHWLNRVLTDDAAPRPLRINRAIRRELLAFSDLLNMPGPHVDHKKRIGPDAAVYLCWYTQLRDLIDEHPELGEKLDVRALPANGFRGDWWIGVAAGSVSMKLGEEVINILCCQREQYRRFAAGVGLPVKENFANADFNAWPHAGTSLQRIMEIHGNALSRREIKKYEAFRAVVAVIAKRLVRPQQSHDDIVRNVERLPGQIAVLLANPR